MSAGGEYSCGIGTSGAAYCWGRNDVGQLGDGSDTTRLVPVLVAAPAGVKFVAVDAGDRHACGVSDAGVAYCWGTTPTPVAAPPGVRFTSITVGGEHTCALTPDASAYCWVGNETPVRVE